MEASIKPGEGHYAATVLGDSIVVEGRVTTWGRADGQVVGVDGLTSTRSGTVIVFDDRLQRITRWDSLGATPHVLALGPTPDVDEYVAAGGTVAVVSSRVGKAPYAPVEAELRALDSLGFAGAPVAVYPTRALRVPGAPRGALLRRRPLEQQQIVRWSPREGWIIASTDSLQLRVGNGRAARIVVGRGERAEISNAVRDSSVEAYARRASAKPDRQARARAFAQANLFRDRTHLPLIDEVVPVLDGRIAARRMGLCRDRHGWNVLDTAGHAAGTFSVPLTYQPVIGLRDDVLFTTVESATNSVAAEAGAGGRVGFRWVPLPGGTVPQVAARP